MISPFCDLSRRNAPLHCRSPIFGPERPRRAPRGQQGFGCCMAQQTEYIYFEGDTARRPGPSAPSGAQIRWCQPRLSACLRRPRSRLLLLLDCRAHRCGSLTCLCSSSMGGLAMEAAAGTSRRGRASKERNLPPMQHPSIGPKQTATSAARRARGKLEYCASSPETASAGACALAAHAAAGFALEAAAETPHHGCASKREASRWCCALL